jgi:hypothetical protein
MRRCGTWCRQVCGEAVDEDALADPLGLAVQVGDGVVGIAGVVVFVVLDEALLDDVADLWFGDDLQGEKGRAEVGGIPAEAALARSGGEVGVEGRRQQSAQAFAEVERHEFLQVIRFRRDTAIV